jgi:hypothetical protein
MKAFPNKKIDNHGYDVYSTGMDLRDYFAARAMQGLLNTALNENVPKDQVAEVAYKIADSMMKARSK